MAQNITLLGASYSAVPGVKLPKTGGGTALFTDVSPTTASAADVAQGKIFFNSSGQQQTGSKQFVTYYTGSTNPSSSLGQNGDIYLKVVG